MASKPESRRLLARDVRSRCSLTNPCARAAAGCGPRAAAGWIFRWCRRPGRARPLLPVVERAARAAAAGRRGARPSGCALRCWNWRRASSRRCRCSTGSAVPPGDAERAPDALLRRIVQLHPNTFWATHELALALFSRGAIAEAEIHARNAVRIAPENPQSHNLMGMVMTEANRPQIGEYHYRRVWSCPAARPDPARQPRLEPEEPGPHGGGARALRGIGAAAPEVLQTLLGWARLEEADRNFDARRRDARPRRAAGARQSQRHAARARCCTAAAAPMRRRWPILDQAAGAEREGRGLGPNELLEKGRLLDRLGRYDEAFAAFAEGKRLCREVSGLVYLAEHARQQADRLKRLLHRGPAARSCRAPGCATTRAQPIFILGFPRSGHDPGRADLVGASAHLRPATNCRSSTRSPTRCVRAAEQPAGLSRGAGRIVDGRPARRARRIARLLSRRVAPARHPGAGRRLVHRQDAANETHLGLIALMFPRSPLIHVLRHPLDVVLSVVLQPSDARLLLRLRAGDARRATTR